MRYSRFKQQMEGTTSVPRSQRPKKKAKTSKDKSNSDGEERSTPERQDSEASNDFYSLRSSENYAIAGLKPDSIMTGTEQDGTFVSPLALMSLPPQPQYSRYLARPQDNRYTYHNPGYPRYQEPYVSPYLPNDYNPRWLSKTNISFGPSIPVSASVPAYPVPFGTGPYPHETGKDIQPTSQDGQREGVKEESLRRKEGPFAI